MANPTSRPTASVSRMILRGAVMAAWLLSVAACQPASDSANGSDLATGGTPSERLGAVVEKYYDAYLELNPLVASGNGDPRFNDRLPNSLSEQWLADLLALEQQALAELDGIDAEMLSASERLTYDQFRYGRQVAIEGFRFPEELLPINQFANFPVFFGQMGAGGSIQPFNTTKDYDDFLARMKGFVTWTDQAIANMREGMARQVVQPRVIVEKTLPQIESFLVSDPTASVFYTPVRSFPEGVSAADRARLTRGYLDAISGQLLPAYRRLHEFLAREYLPAARPTVATRDLPNGDAWYGYLVRLHTTTAMTPAEIHAIGVAEVKRIRSEMDQLKTQVGFKGDLPAFFAYLKSDPAFRFETPEQLLEAYSALKERVVAALPALFDQASPGDFEIRAVEPNREQSEAAASYMPGTPDGSRPGVLYVNTYDLASRPNYMIESNFLHEAVPGHHFQLALQRQAGDLPRFRRFGGDTAYVEGWALYAESLGRELGLFTDPYQQFGALTAEMWRAVRLVVDTGIHAQGWTREQAIEYMQQNTTLGEADIIAEVERYIASPGQALAYKIGQRKIRELRNRAERSLKGRFDVRSFHTELLKDGSLSLAVLDAKLARWESASGAR